MENIHDTLSGKMSPEHSAATMEKTSTQSSKSSRKLPTQTCMFLDLRAKGRPTNLLGDTLDPLWEMDGLSRGERSMPNTGEFPSVVVESTLSEILEANAPEKYYLSAKACEGILRRAERRGKELPPMLKTALEQTLERETPSENQGGIAIVEPVVYDGANVTSPINKSKPRSGDPCHTLSTDSRNYAVYCLQGNGIDRADTAGCNGKGWKQDSCYTLNTIDRPAVAYATDIGFFNSQENVSPTLLARMYKDLHLVTSEGSEIYYIVRRLTPTECCRLQGFPDWWEDGVEGSDSARYKMWGNGMALPNMLYVMQGIKATEDKRRGFDVWVRSSKRWG